MESYSSGLTAVKLLLHLTIISNYFKFMQFLFDLGTARLCKTSWFWFRVVHDAPSQRIRSAPAISASFSVTKAPRAACKALRQLGALWNLVTSCDYGSQMVTNLCVKKSVTKVAWKTWNFWLESSWVNCPIATFCSKSTLEWATVVFNSSQTQTSKSAKQR